MKTEKLNYYLPSELIAQNPLSVRSDSRLLVLDRSVGDVSDSRFSSLGDFLLPGDCLVLNDTKVLPARFFAGRTTGGKLEGLFLAADAAGVWTAYLKGIRKLKPGDEFYLKDRQKTDFCKAVLLEKIEQGRCRLQPKTDADAQTVLDEIGFPPLPPYIKRGDDPVYIRINSYSNSAFTRPNDVGATATLYFLAPMSFPPSPALRQGELSDR